VARFPCDGPMLDEPGIWICRMDPEDPSFDCENCHIRNDWQRWEELMADAAYEEQMMSDRREPWGG